MFKKFLAISPVVFLMSCASLSEEACRSGDWGAIGYNDGVRGRAENYISEHREACGEYGIAPNTAVWLRSRIEGLKQYCTPDNAYSVGRHGSELNNVCPTNQSSDLRLANFFGLRYYEIGREIDALDDEVDDIRLTLASDFADELTPEQIQMKNFYLLEIIKLQRDIRKLEFEQRKYAARPQ
ncbi:hypothetical protein A9Q96_06345 [Rhodobacterales bacterium 52_120_T64]|nr:hypothetical protein A9Q96_06345 [Rhodobacterales bacterium 52_120_T64]